MCHITPTTHSIPTQSTQTPQEPISKIINNTEPTSQTSSQNLYATYSHDTASYISPTESAHLKSHCSHSPTALSHLLTLTKSLLL